MTHGIKRNGRTQLIENCPSLVTWVLHLSARNMSLLQCQERRQWTLRSYCAGSKLRGHETLSRSTIQVDSLLHSDRAGAHENLPEDISFSRRLVWDTCLYSSQVKLQSSRKMYLILSDCGSTVGSCCKVLAKYVRCINYILRPNADHHRCFTRKLLHFLKIFENQFFLLQNDRFL